VPITEGAMMAQGPRVVFTRFDTETSPKLALWSAHVSRVLAREDVAPTEPDPHGEESVLVWQLVSANNRQIARCARQHRSFDAAWNDATEVVATAGELEFVQVSERGRGVYGWYARASERPVLVCAKWYITDRDRRQSMQLASLAVAKAELRTGARLIDPALMAQPL
jgi:hypothetical protein